MGNETTIPLTALTAEREKAKLDLATATARIAELEAKQSASETSGVENIFNDDYDIMGDTFGSDLTKFMQANNATLMKDFKAELSKGFTNRDDEQNLSAQKAKYEIFSDEDKDIVDTANILLSQALENRGEKTEEEIFTEVAKKVSRFKVNGQSTAKTVPTTVAPNVGTLDASHLEVADKTPKTMAEAEANIEKKLQERKNNPIK